jgi:hypothetical protein
MPYDHIRRALLACLIALPALAHGPAHEFSPDEIAWMNRQHSRGDAERGSVKCCDERDVYIALDVHWRLAQGHYEVMMNGGWVRVPPHRLMRIVRGDPSPWDSAAILFYSPGQPLPWCFLPEPLM